MSARRAIIILPCRSTSSINNKAPLSLQPHRTAARGLVAFSTRCLSCYYLPQQQLLLQHRCFNGDNNIIINNISSSSSSSGHVWTASSSPLSYSFVSTRSFAISSHRRNQKNRRDDSNNSSNMPLSNEQLVSALMRRFQADSADNVQVRVLMDNNNNNKRESDSESDNESSSSSSSSSSSVSSTVLTLAQAIQTAVAAQHDLFEVALHQDVPVLRIACLQTLQYQKNKNKNTSKQQQQQNHNETKEFRFSAKIADNDLLRKVNQITTALSKHYICLISVQCRGWQARQEPGLLKATMDRVMNNLPADSYEIVQPVRQVHAAMARFSIRPSQKFIKEQQQQTK